MNSNDNNLRTHEDHRSFNNAALLGAIAGAGLSSATQVAAEGRHTAEFRGAHSDAISTQVHPLTQFAAHDGVSIQSVSAQLGHGGAPAHDMVTSQVSLSTDSAKLAGLAGHEQVHMVSQFAHSGTETPSFGSDGATPMATAAAIVMPSAQQLAGLADHGGGAQHVEDKIVAQVLADALHGEGGHNLDALINALPGHGGHANALEALASHGAEAVSFGHSGGFAGFTSGHDAPIMDQ